MSAINYIPRILIIDDLFGRTHLDRRNEERANLCGQYLIEDVTGDEAGKGSVQKIKRPVAQAVFFRGQTPTCATVGDIVKNDLEGTLKVIKGGWTEWRPNSPRWTLVILDLCFYQGHVTPESNQRVFGMPEGDKGDDDPEKYFGLTILRAIQRKFPDIPVIILSSKERKGVSRAFSEGGARGFIPREDAGSPELLEDFINRHGLIPDSDGEIIGHSKGLLIALRAARNVARARKNVLLRGERGVGKELMARYIHRHSGNAAAPFVVVNSSVCTPELYASELFGIRGGTATGVQARPGRIPQADGGDLFFDEVGDMLPPVQAGLLRVLEEQQVTPVGAAGPQYVDVRFISATNKDIEALSGMERFRRDLLDRLRSGDSIFLVPLRERTEDIPLLVEKFVREAEQETPNALTREVVPEALAICMAHHWPGNLRALRNCIYSAVRNFPDVEYLVAAHLCLPSGDLEQDRDVVPSRESQPLTNTQTNGARTLDEVVAILSDFNFGALNREHLMGKLALLERAYARLIAQYLLAALDMTSRSSPQKPHEKIQYTPAIHLLREDWSIKATSAADEIKRLLGISTPDIEDLLAHTKLGEVYHRTLKLRSPSKRKTKTKV